MSNNFSAVSYTHLDVYKRQGYMFPAMEHDKDGISAAVVLLQAYCKWKIDSNLDPIDILENGFQKYGVFKEYNGYYVVPSPLVTTEIFEYIRNVYTPTGCLLYTSRCV